MAISLATARKWCNDSEFALVSASFGGRDIAWTPALLRAKIERTRRLRDKNRDQYRKIRRGNRATTGAKVGRQVTAMAVAEKRAKLFDETLSRFTAKLEKLNASRRMQALRQAVAEALVRKRAQQGMAGGKGRKQAPGAARKPAGVKAVRRTSAAVELKRKQQMARVRARNVRNQARRDSRG
jgi:hypothetical protein